MEKRLLMAIVLSFLVLVLYQVLFVKKKPEVKPPAEALTEERVTKKEPLFPPESTPAEKKPLEEKISTPVAEVSEKQIVIETSLFRATWSNKGAVLKSWILKKYQGEEKNNLELVSPRSSEANIFPLSLLTEDPSFNREVNDVFYKSSALKLELKDGQNGEIRLEYADDKGTSVEKVFMFHDGKYDFNAMIRVKKYGQEIEPRIIWGPGFGDPSLTKQGGRFGGAKGIAVMVSNKVHRVEERKFKPEESEFIFADWAAYEDNYFAAVFLISQNKSRVEFIKEGTEEIPDFLLSLAYPHRIYIGPKDYDILREFSPGTKNLIKFGFFGFIAEILLRTIKIIHKAFPNWGISIIILTFIIKIIFFPLTYSSTRSMAKMQELQPKIKALRAKHKKAKQDIAQRRKMNEETMKLYKEHGINPAGGCLPMLVQIPVFWGFFRLLMVAIEFRHSPFMLWIKDLSIKDPYYVTPILMGLTQFISQKMTPTSADPTQARMMLIMPVIMTIFFMGFPSGLVLYWLTSNLLQIAQQYIMNRISQKKKREAHGKKRRKK